MASSLPTRGKQSPHFKHPAFFGAAVVLAPVMWVSFISNFSAHDLLLGGLACVATALFLIFVCRASNLKLTVRGNDVLQLWRLPAYIAKDSYAITAVLLKDLFGLESAKSLYRVCGFDTSGHDPLRKARTVLATAYTTASPNTIVVGVDPSQSRMLFHQVVSSPVSKMTKALGAKS